MLRQNRILRSHRRCVDLLLHRRGVRDGRNERLGRDRVGLRMRQCRVECRVGDMHCGHWRRYGSDWRYYYVLHGLNRRCDDLRRLGGILLGRYRVGVRKHVFEGVIEREVHPAHLVLSKSQKPTGNTR